VAAKATKPRPSKGRLQHPQRGPAPPGRARWLYVAAAVGLAVLAAVVAVVATRGGGSETTSAGLPDTSDYHSLLVSPANGQSLLLGTHQGLYASSDGGRTWWFDTLSGSDAMNLVRPGAKTIWLAGHQVFKKSTDAGASWLDVRPSGLPGLDIHGFAVDPSDPRTLFAAIAGQGLYRSRDGGRSFAPVSRDVGGNVMALAMMPDGRLLAGDMRQGLLVSGDGGREWRQTRAAQVIGIAVDPGDPKRVLGAGAGGIALSADGGRHWRSVLALPDGAGPVAWSPSDPSLAYAVGFDRNLYRSSDGGASWQPVGEGS
jgi:photosystem II stability/assembly factor-like uncharacterized protein